jgi:DNA invertase Pin-like site-specific DNA recombinase
LDRFARELLIQISLLAKLAAEGLTLVAANTGENVTDAMNDDPMRKAMVQIQGVFAELDKNLLVRKLKKGREAKRAATGRCEGQKPFGHYDGESDVIDRIRQLRRKPRGKDRSSFADVAAELNAAGHRNRAGREWSRAMVHHVAKENGIA